MRHDPSRAGCIGGASSGSRGPRLVSTCCRSGMVLSLAGCFRHCSGPPYVSGATLNHPVPSHCRWGSGGAGRASHSPETTPLARGRARMDAPAACCTELRLLNGALPLADGSGGGAARSRLSLPPASGSLSNHSLQTVIWAGRAGTFTQHTPAGRFTSITVPIAPVTMHTTGSRCHCQESALKHAPLPDSKPVPSPFLGPIPSQ